MPWHSLTSCPFWWQMSTMKATPSKMPTPIMMKGMLMTTLALVTTTCSFSADSSSITTLCETGCESLKDGKRCQRTAFSLFLVCFSIMNTRSICPVTPGHASRVFNSKTKFYPNVKISSFRTWDNIDLKFKTFDNMNTVLTIARLHQTDANTNISVQIHLSSNWGHLNVIIKQIMSGQDADWSVMSCGAFRKKVHQTRKLSMAQENYSSFSY